MASVSSSTYPFPSSGLNQRPAIILAAQFRVPTPRSGPGPGPEPEPKSLPSSSTNWITTQPSRGRTLDVEKLKEKEAKERKEEVNRKIASRKAISIILRREATKALIEKKRGPTQSKKLLPRTVLESLHERITALRWESALKVSSRNFEPIWLEFRFGNIWVHRAWDIKSCSSAKLNSRMAFPFTTDWIFCEFLKFSRWKKVSLWLWNLKRIWLNFVHCFGNINFRT